MSGEEKRRISQFVLGIGVEVELADQVSGGVVAAMQDRMMKGVAFPEMGILWIGPVLGEKGDDGGMTVFGGDDQSGFEFVVAFVRVGALLEEYLGGVGIAAMAGLEELSVDGAHKWIKE